MINSTHIVFDIVTLRKPVRLQKVTLNNIVNDIDLNWTYWLSITSYNRKWSSKDIDNTHVRNTESGVNIIDV